jgi:hypothetical protein
MSTTRLKVHPILGCLICSDGHIMLPPSQRSKSRYTLGWLGKNGYYYVNIGRKKYSVHRLIIETFIGPIPKGMVVDHINRITTDNRIENLRVVSYRENNINTIRHDRCVAKYGVSSITDKREYSRRQLLQWRREHPEKVSEQNKRNHDRNYKRRRTEHPEKVTVYNLKRAMTSKNVRFADGSRKRLPNEVALEYLKLPVRQRIYRRT